MTDPFTDQKRRPPPIRIPPIPGHMPVPQNAHPPRAISHQSHQQQPQLPRETRNASSSTQQGQRSATTPLTSPLEENPPRLPQSGSQKSRTSAMTTLTTLMEQARASPRKSDQGSTTAKSTTRSRHSERSHHSTVAAQAQLEALEEDERTTRGKIESRTEMNLFKMTGQVPPTPILSAYIERLHYTAQLIYST